MVSICLLVGLLMTSGSASALAPPSFSGSLRLPVDLYAAKGAHLEKGEYSIRVKQVNGQYSLTFTQDNHPKLTVKGEILREDAGDENASLPLIGTQYLHSSADPVGTEAQRHFSHSGLPHYQEESRDWKATLRAYSTEDQKESLWFFEERQAEGKWSHIQFILYLSPQ